MSGMKLLLNRWFSNRVCIIITFVLFAGMMTAVMIFHEEPHNYDNEQADYLMCKMCALLPMILGVLLLSILMAAQMVGNRFMRAIPAAEKLFTVGFPVFGLLVSLAWGLAINLCYALFVLVSGRDICNISDMLIMTAPFSLFCTIIPPVMFSSRFGATFGMLGYLPFLILTFSIHGMPEVIRYDGFGVPLWASALIVVAAYLLGFAVGAVISWNCYRKGNFREQQYYSGTYKR